MAVRPAKGNFAKGVFSSTWRTSLAIPALTKKTQGIVVLFGLMEGKRWSLSYSPGVMALEIPPLKRDFKTFIPWFRPKWVLSRWVSRNVPAPWRARIGKLFATARVDSTQLKLDLPSPILWQRPPLLIASVGQEDSSLRSLFSSDNLGTNPWPLFLALSQGEKHVRLSNLSGETEDWRLASLRRLPKIWASSLGLVLPLKPTHSAFARLLAQQTGYPVGPSFIDLFPTWQNDGPPEPKVLDARLSRLFPKVSVLVVTFNQRVLTELCLRSMQLFTDYPNWELVLVDNGSDSETIAALEKWAAQIPGTRLHLNPINRGFPAACNQGAALADGEILCLLNNDTVVSPGWLSALVDELLRDSRVGLVGPVSNGVSNEARVKVPWETLQALPFWTLYRHQTYFRQSRRVAMLAFYCIAMRQGLWKKLGGLNEEFGLGLFEDDEFSYRVSKAGLHLRCRLDAYVHHFQSSSFAQLSDIKYLQVYERNRKLFARKRRLSRGDL